MIELPPVLKGLSPIFLLFLSMALLFGAVRRYLDEYAGKYSGVITGLFFGLAAMISMSMGVLLPSGVPVDGRLMMVGLSGAYGGIASGITTASIATLYHLLQGADNLAAAFVCVTGSCLIGLLFYRYRKPEPAPFSPFTLALLGVCLAGYVQLAALLFLPAEICLPILKALSLPAFIVYPAAISLMGYIFNRQRLQDKLTRDLALSHNRMESLVAERTSDLAGSKEKYTNLARAAFEGIVISERGIIVEVNNSLCRMTGYSPEEIIGRPAVDLIAPEDREFARQRVSQGSENLAELFCLRKNGSLFPGEIQAKMFEYKGRRTRVAALRDISERKKASQALKESEQLYKALFEKNTTVILLINPGDGHIVDANPAACAFYGYDRADLTRMKISDINQLTPSQVKMEMAMAQSEQRQYFNFRHRISTGLVRDVEVYSGPVQVHDRPLLCSIIHDISERKAIEAERESLILKLKKALEEIKTLKGIVPICSSCNKIRDDQGYWNRLEAYIEERSHASFSHGICPDCSDKLYGEEEWYDENKADKK